MATPAPSVLGYQYLMLGQARAILVQRLEGASTPTYWTAQELNLCLYEALHVWQALTGYYRERCQALVDSTSPFWDLAATGFVTGGTGTYAPTPFDYHITDQQVISEILYHLIEPQLSGFTWQGSDQFNLTQVANALQNRISRFMGDSGCVASYLLQNTAPPPVQQFNIPDNIIDVRRAAWVDWQGVRHPLFRSDLWAVEKYKRSWVLSSAPYPKVFVFDPAVPGSMQVFPPSATPGNIELIYVSSGTQINPQASSTVIACPDDYLWGIKYGAMADLLGQDAQSRDPVRATYCENRYQQAVELAKTFPAVQTAYGYDVPLFLMSAFDADSYKRSWLTVAPGRARYAIMSGRNVLALSPQPSPGITTTFDLIRNMPLPQADNQYLQVSRDVADVLLDYAQHAASFKMAGVEFDSTSRLYANLVKLAGEYNSRIRQFSFYADALRQAGLTQLAEVTRTDIPLLARYTGDLTEVGVNG